jgi:hypothetical protein
MLSVYGLPLRLPLCRNWSSDFTTAKKIKFLYAEWEISRQLKILNVQVTVFFDSCITHLPHACYRPYLYTPSFVCPNDVWWRIISFSAVWVHFCTVVTFMYWEMELTFCSCFRNETDKRNKDEPYSLDVLERETKYSSSVRPDFSSQLCLLALSF